MSDIVQRLRAKHVFGTFEIDEQRQEAADEIERLRSTLLQIEQETIDHVAVGISRKALAGCPKH